MAAATLAAVATTLLLARHGETDWNREHRWQGHADPPLNEVGREQARELARRARRRSARRGLLERPAAGARDGRDRGGRRTGSRCVAMPALREIDVGEWSGLTSDEIEERFPAGWERHAAGGDGWEHGETHDAMSRRVVAAVAELAAPIRTGTSCCVLHGGAIRAAPRACRGSRARPVPPHGARPGQRQRRQDRGRGGRPGADRLTRCVEDYTNKYKGEQLQVALFGGEYQDGVLTAYCYVDDVAHIELNGHILIPLQNVASLHCSSRCDAPEPDWPPHGLAEDDTDERDDEA